MGSKRVLYGDMRGKIRVCLMDCVTFSVFNFVTGNTESLTFSFFPLLREPLLVPPLSADFYYNYFVCVGYNMQTDECVPGTARRPLRASYRGG